jgi:hypothetical protein
MTIFALSSSFHIYLSMFRSSTVLAPSLAAYLGIFAGTCFTLLSCNIPPMTITTAFRNDTGKKSRGYLTMDIIGLKRISFVWGCFC